VKHSSSTRKLGKNRLIELIDLLVDAGKNDALREVLIRSKGNVNVRIDDVNERIHRVFRTVKVVREGDVERIISVFTTANLQLPPCKVGLFFKISVKTHVLTKVKNCDLPPKDGFFYAGPYNLRSRTLENDRQDLLKVTTKDNGKTIKGLVRIAQIFERAVNSLHDVTMQHGCFIPNDQVSLTDQSSQRGVFGDGAK